MSLGLWAFSHWLFAWAILLNSAVVYHSSHTDYINSLSGITDEILPY